MKKRNFLVVVILLVFFGVFNFVYVSLFLQGGLRPEVNSDINFTTKKDFKELNQIMGFEESFVDVKVYDDKFLIFIKGLREFPIEKIDKILNTKLHVSEKLSIYSLVFVNNFLNKVDLNDEIAFQKLADAIYAVLSDVNKRDLLPNKMKFNDHVVAVRMETLIKFIAYAEQYHKELYTQELKKIINLNIKWCYDVLINEDYFTWKTNHGLMQIRALLAYGYAFDNLGCAKQGNMVASKRAAQLLDFHIAADGSVYESASGYWYYIYDQWSKISFYDDIENSTAKKIQNRLEESESFLKTVTFSNGFLQGIGDATNRFIDNNIIGVNNSNNVFKFANGLGGFNLSDANNNELGVLFTSLYNPPNVHKHPEDLSVYIYYNQQPYFINPGVFAYDESDNRKYITSQKAQNTIYSNKKNTPDSSKLYAPKVLPEGKIALEGNKYYNTFKINRKAILDISKEKLTILDNAEQLLSPIINYNVHPDVEIKKIDNHNLILYGNTSNIEVKFSKPYTINKSIVSRSNSNIDSINQIVINSNELITDFKFSKFGFEGIEIKEQINNVSSNQRLIKSKELSDYYNNELYLKQSNKRLVIPRTVFLFISIITVFLMGKIKLIRPFYYIAFIFVFFVYLLDVIYKGTFLSLSYFY